MWGGIYLEVRGGGDEPPPQQQNDQQPPPPSGQNAAGGANGNAGRGGRGNEEEFYEEYDNDLPLYSDEYVPHMIPGTPVTGLSGVLTHLAKPINVALSKKYRDDPTYVNRARKHMSRITSDYVHEALNQEQVIVHQQKQIEALIAMFSDMRSDLNEVQLSHRTAARAAVEKLNNIVPKSIGMIRHM
jgi:hypothetical protein